MVGDKHQHRIRIGRLRVAFNGFEGFRVRAARIKRFYAADKKHLKGRHQRGSARRIQHFPHVVLRQIEFVERELAQLWRHQVAQDGFAATLAKESFIADQHVGGLQPTLAHLCLEAFGRRKAAAGGHQKASSRSLTMALAKSRAIRSSAGDSSSKKLVISRDTWYSSRKV